MIQSQLSTNKPKPYMGYAEHHTSLLFRRQRLWRAPPASSSATVVATAVPRLLLFGWGRDGDQELSSSFIFYGDNEATKDGESVIK